MEPDTEELGAKNAEYEKEVGNVGAYGDTPVFTMGNIQSIFTTKEHEEHEGFDQNIPIFVTFVPPLKIRAKGPRSV